MQTASSYDFPVAKESVYIEGEYNDKEIRGKKAVVRVDTGEVLGIVSDKYEIIKHADVVDAFRQSLAGRDFSESIRVTKKGAHLFATYRLNAEKVEVKKGDLVSLQFVVKNSYDGTNTLQISLGAYRLVCTNGMVIGKRFFGYTQRHIGSNVGIDIGKLEEKLGVLVSQFHNTLPIMQRMIETPIKENSVQYDPSMARLPEYILKEASEEYQRSGEQTVWGYYNSLTYAITHKMKRSSPQAQIEYGRIAWDLARREVADIGRELPSPTMA